MKFYNIFVYGFTDPVISDLYPIEEEREDDAKSFIKTEGKTENNVFKLNIADNGEPWVFPYLAGDFD